MHKENKNAIEQRKYKNNSKRMANMVLYQPNTSAG